MKEKIKTLEEVSNPVVDYLKKYYDPYCNVVISTTSIKLVRDEIGIPINDNDD